MPGYLSQPERLDVYKRQGVRIDHIISALAEFQACPGRFELINEGQPLGVVVDYAHTPDGLENILKTAKEITKGRILVVFGCGGDRDRKKRPIMGAIAAKYSDIAIITSDNPVSYTHLDVYKRQSAYWVVKIN